MNIPTAEEFIKSTELVVKFDNTQGCILEEELPNLLKNFAKLHVEGAKQEIVKKAKTKDDWSGNTGSEYCCTVVDEDSILNAYPLTNIK